jgi:hypothetical protein
MPPTNRDVRTRLRVVDARLRQLECGGGGRAAARAQLREEREILNLVLLNRRVEAARRVVDLERWRTANGALALDGDAREAAALAG